MSTSSNYPLGYSEQEAQRLARQAVVLEEYTQDVFARAGIQPGMRVLDAGSGVGDVSLLVGRMVGSEGAVLGVERSPESVETARQRAAAAGESHVRFEAADLNEFKTDEAFDAIVGRLVLLYIPDRVAVLKKLARHLRPGGIIAFLELDMTQIAQNPPSDLFLRARKWLLDGFAAGGAELDMGTKLYSTFLQSGLSAPNMMAVHPAVSGSDFPAYEDVAHGLRSLLPVIESKGIATSEEMDLDTLACRLREDAAANERVVFMSRVVGAWSRLS